MRAYLSGFAVFGILFQAGFLPVSAAFHPDVKASSFCYDQASCGPSNWPGICQTGRLQSPINIQFSRLRSFQPRNFHMNRHYLSERIHLFYGQNNGHTAQFELNSNTSALMSNLKICGGHLGHCYKFAQLHFHWGETDREGSEHTINGQRFALELHLVHYRNNFRTLADALNSKDPEAVAVVAVLFKVGGHNKALNSIIRSLSEIEDPGDVMAFNLPLRISDFYPSFGEYAHYRGSLTTPTCDEKVVWTVFLRPMEISEQQINQFRLLSNDEGHSDHNFRPIQNLNGRKVEFFQANGFTEMLDGFDTQVNPYPYPVPFPIPISNGYGWPQPQRQYYRGRVYTRIEK